MISRIFSILLSGAFVLVLLVGQAFALSSSYVTDDGGSVVIQSLGAENGGLSKIGQEQQPMMSYSRADENGSVKIRIDAPREGSEYVIRWDLVSAAGEESSGSLAMAFPAPQSCASSKSELPGEVREALQSIWRAVEKDAVAVAADALAGFDGELEGNLLKGSCSALTHFNGVAACATAAACGATGCGGGIGCAGCILAAFACGSYMGECYLIMN